MIKEALKMIYQETDYLLDSYNHNLKHGYENENNKILRDIEFLRQERIGIIYEINELLKPSAKSIRNSYKNMCNGLTDSEIEERAKRVHKNYCEAIINNLMGEY